MADKNAAELFNMKVAHVGLNAACDGEAAGVAADSLRLMGLPTRETSASYFSGDLVEIMKKNGRGTHGHIGFSVNDVEAAIRYFEERGFKAIEETKKIDENGKCFFTYFEGEIGGFAIHIVRQ